MHRVLVLALLLLLPHAAADVRGEARGPGEPLPPETPGEAVFAVEVDCLTLWTQEVVTVLLEPLPSENVTLTGPTDARFHKSDCAAPDGWARQEHVYEVTVAHGPRAGTPIRFHFKATMPPSSMNEERFIVAEARATPAYAGLSQFKVVSQIKETSIDEAPYTFTVDNLGNDDTRYAFSVLEADDGVTVDLPEPFTLEPGEHRELDFTVRVAGSWDQTIVRVGMNATQAGTGEGEEQLATNVMLRNGELGARLRDNPGPGVAAAVLALAAAGVALARRR